jgi:hypothetical protein
VGAALLITPGFHAGAWISYGLLGILGWLVTLIMGILQKLVPHLSRMRLFGHSGRPIPDVNVLINPAAARVALLAAEAGLVTLALGATYSSRPAATVGALLWLTGVLLTIAQLVRIPLMARGWVVVPSAVVGRES